MTKERNHVNLNINPCKMCMPLGAVTAFKGIESSMVILHGSQGCSTYIRRHMAGHYNEPIDIASSSLSEEGTVYGGEQNLKKGLRNVILQYKPSIIGVATTCLAETIGEDIRRITAEFRQQEPAESVEIIPVATPGYGGTQFEGYYAALAAVVRQLAADRSPNGKVNIIAGNVSPGDIRNIKSILDACEVEYILLPELSNTLDSPYSRSYCRMPSGGTPVADIVKMAGSTATIEMGMTVPEAISPGKYLQEAFGIPLYRCPLPIGLQNTDAFLQFIGNISGREIPDILLRERGRLIDGMIDSHKHSAEGRAVIYGEPEQVLAVGRLCCENGIKPVVLATGSRSDMLKELMEEADEGEKPVILSDTDFETIAAVAAEQGANLLIGNSDGKFITEKQGIPLVRIGFPIHDRVGGQRQVFTGYNGTLGLLDSIVNTLLEHKYNNYRRRMYLEYYKPESTTGETSKTGEAPTGDPEEKTANHPCFTAGACKNARIHLPVAPACNVSCNYCNRKFDCVNESRPGVTSEILNPFEAAARFMRVREKLNNLKVVGIAGPGDALANFDQVRKTLSLIRELDPAITFCLSTNGLMLPAYAADIAALGVTHVTITINAVDPKVGAGIYREVVYKGKRLIGEEAAAILIRNQLAGLKALVALGVMCKVNIVMVKGINDEHIEAVVQEVKACGAAITNIMPLIPAEGSLFAHMPLTSNRELNEMRKKCGVHMKQMYHCRQCRADAIGLLGEDIAAEFRDRTPRADRLEKALVAAVYRMAVATGSGMYVDKHFGHVDEFSIYEVSGDKACFVEKRRVEKYCSGAEDCDQEEQKISRTVRVIEDCNAVLVLRIGHSPSKELEKRDIRIFQTCGTIEESLREAAAGMGEGTELIRVIGL